MSFWRNNVLPPILWHCGFVFPFVRAILPTHFITTSCGIDNAIDASRRLKVYSAKSAVCFFAIRFPLKRKGHKW
jgi:hypothetical protein